MSDKLFEGHEPRECGEHRTVGEHRAWCYDDGEWCYPKAPCRGCELAKLRARRVFGECAYCELRGQALAAANAEVARLRAELEAMNANRTTGEDAKR